MDLHGKSITAKSKYSLWMVLMKESCQNPCLSGFITKPTRSTKRDCHIFFSWIKWNIYRKKIRILKFIWIPEWDRMNGFYFFHPFQIDRMT